MEDTRPTLTTDRLILRPFTLADAPDVQRLAGEKAIATNTGRIPHPYEDGMAEAWIATHAERHANGEGLNLAITLAETGQLIGAIGGTFHVPHKRATLGYWVGLPYWNRGYCTEAAGRVVRYIFEELRFNRIEAYHYGRNPASGRVMQKIGMTYEATLRKHTLVDGSFDDDVRYAILREEFKTKKDKDS